jgi:hypothetical protein
MALSRVHRLAPGILIWGWLAVGSLITASDDSLPQETADQRFEKLYSAALKDSEKADWKELRRAFAATTHYNPYGIGVPEKLRGIALQIGRGELKASEAALLELLERERQMRLDTLAMTMQLYEKMDQPEKVQRYQKLIEPVLEILFNRDAGMSFEKPIEVLFIQEEYVVTVRMRIKDQALAIHDGHKFDVITVEAQGDEPERKFYFNVDLPRMALSRDLEESK